MNNSRASLGAMACVVVFSSGVAAREAKFFTSFEPEEDPPFAAGNLDGQNGWEVTAGAAVIQDTVSYQGLQAARFDPTGTTQAEWNSAGFKPSAQNVDFFVQVGDPNLALPAASPRLDISGAIVELDVINGLEVFDGGAGAEGAWVSTSQPLLSNQWHRVTLRIDFAGASWDVLVDGVEVRTGLGLAAGSPAAFRFLRVAPNSRVVYLDALALYEKDPASDTDGDGLPDVDEENLVGTDPENPDTDGDRGEDRQEVVAGTDPVDPESVFDVVVRAAQGVVRVEFLTAPGRLYTVEYTDALAPPAWGPVADPAFVDRAGTGALVVYEETPGVPTRQYRVKVVQQ